MTLRKFLIMVENDVAGELVCDDVFDHNKKMCDALIDEVEVIEVDLDTEVGGGYIWDGTNFNNPKS